MPLEDDSVSISGPVALAVSLTAGAVIDTGGLQVNVFRFVYDLGGTKGIFAGATGVVLTDGTTNYIYLDSAATLQVSTVGFPGGLHLRLAEVTTSGGVIVNIQDERAILTAAAAGGGGGEVNDGANVGVGTGVFRNKTGVILNFRSLQSLASFLTIALSGSGDEVDFNVVPSNLDHAALGNLLADAHTQYILVNGARAFTGNQSFGNNSATGLRTGTFNAEFDNGNSGAAATINWTQGQKQRITLTGNATLSFTNPGGPCNLILKLIQDGTGSRNVTWPANVRFPNGTPPALTGPPNSIDIVAFYFDGTDYFAVSSLNFS